MILPRLRVVGGSQIFSDALQAPYRLDLGTIPKREPDIDWAQYGLGRMAFLTSVRRFFDWRPRESCLNNRRLNMH